MAKKKTTKKPAGKPAGKPAAGGNPKMGMDEELVKKGLWSAPMVHLFTWGVPSLVVLALGLWPVGALRPLFAGVLALAVAASWYFTWPRETKDKRAPFGAVVDAWKLLVVDGKYKTYLAGGMGAVVVTLLGLWWYLRRRGGGMTGY